MCREIVGHDSEEIQRIYYRPDEMERKLYMNELGKLL